jgi:hypothetical protein
MGFLEFLSAVFGVIYFTAWSVSFYPQVLLNFRRKSTSGTTVDFPLINCLGTQPPVCLVAWRWRWRWRRYTVDVRCSAIDLLRSQASQPMPLPTSPFTTRP